MFSFIRKKTLVIASGGFDPIHVGHVQYLKEARKLGDRLLVIINRDEFLLTKKGYVFMPWNERAEIVDAIQGVDCTIKSIDEDQTVIRSIEYVHDGFKDLYKLVFAKGGDRTEKNTPERGVCQRLGIRVEYHVGGDKVRSSSDLVRKLQEKVG